MYKNILKIIFLGVSLVSVFVKANIQRNPFVPVLNFEKRENEGQDKNDLFLAAILVQGEFNGAVIGKKEKREVVFVGDRVWEYFVKRINSNSVLLSDQSGRLLKLTKK